MGKPQIVLITGATTGIGRTTALHLARLGHRVFATGRNRSALESLQSEAAGLPLETFVLDVTDAASIDAAVATVDERTDGHGLDVLVNNAGYGNMGPLEQVTDKELRDQFETNVFGLLRLCQRFAPQMRARRAGKIINVSSMVGQLALPLQGVYCATKHAVEALSDALRMELASFGVSVVVLEPGSIRTEFETTINRTAGQHAAEDSPYAPAVRRYGKVTAQTYKTAPGPACVARAVARIMGKRRPAARYMSPRTMWALIWLVAILPTCVLDWVVRRIMGLTPKALRVDPRSTPGAP